MGLLNAIAAIAGSTGFGNVASLGSSIIGAHAAIKANKATNATNLQISRETNELNKQLFYDNQAWNKAMWDLQNEYNTPYAQAMRLREAGLNPFLGDVQPSMASSVPSSTPPAMVGATMQSDAPYIQNAFQQIANTFLQGSVIAANNRKTAEDTESVRLQNAYDRASMAARLIEQRERARSSEARSALDVLNTKFAEQTFDNGIARNKFELEQSIAQYNATIVATEGQNLQNELQRITNKYIEPQLVANILQTIAQTALTRKQATLVSAQTVKERLLSQGIRISNDQARQLVKPIVDKAKNEAEISGLQKEYYSTYGTFDIGTQGEYEVGGSVSAEAGTNDWLPAGVKVRGEVHGGFKGRYYNKVKHR